MIGKKVDHTSGGGGKAGRVRGLSDYISSPESRDAGEKCILFGAENFMTESLEGQQAEMIALAESNTRSPDPIRHYIVSWREGEVPTDAQVRDAVRIIQKEMGLEGLQTFYGLHADTDNYHLHLMVNRIDPVTEKARDICGGYDVDGLHRAVALIEHKQGWQVEANKRFVVMENGEVAKVLDDGKTVTVSQQKADREVQHGEKSALRLAQEKAAPIIKDAQTWQQVHEGLATIGMRYEKRGSGAVIFVGDDAVKASDVSSAFTLGKMQKRLGEYLAPEPGLAVSERPREALDDVTRDLGWKDYSAERLKYAAERKQAKAELDAEIKRQRTELYAQQQARRKEVLGGDWRNRGDERNVTAHLLAVEQAKAKAELESKIKEMRETNRESFPASFESFESWLKRSKGMDAVDTWRNRGSVAQTRGASESMEPKDIRNYDPIRKGQEILYSNKRTDMVDFVDRGQKIDFMNRDDDAVLAGLQLSQQRFGKSLTLYGSDDFKAQAVRLAVANGITIANPELQDSISAEKERQRMERMEAHKTQAQRAFEPYHKALGADTYRVSSRSESGQVWVMGKAADGSVPGFTPDRMPFAKIQSLADKGTEHLYYTPLSKTHHIILIDDTTPEKIEQMKRDGITPALVQQTSPNSYQAFVKIPRIDAVDAPHLEPKRRSLEYLASVKLAQELNDAYGDPEVTNAIQPGRAPGTPNAKPKHRQPDGTLPKVQIIEMSGQSAALEGRLQLQMEVVKAEADRQKAPQRNQDVHQVEGQSPAQTKADVQDQAIYDAFKKDIEKRILKGPASDPSSLDYMIAIRLRATGHDRQDVQRIVEGCTDKTGRRHTWADYAGRTASAAFGPKGTADLDRYAKYAEKWQQIADKALGKGTPPQTPPLAPQVRKQVQQRIQEKGRDNGMER